MVVDELVKYFAEMDEMKRYISSQVEEATAAAVENSGKMLLDVSINNPYVIVPVSSCLLYTSPSPRDQRGSRMPSSA